MLMKFLFLLGLATPGVLFVCVYTFVRQWLAARSLDQHDTCFHLSMEHAVVIVLGFYTACTISVILLLRAGWVWQDFAAMFVASGLFAELTLPAISNILGWEQPTGDAKE